jgi:acetyl-CoA acetyltransferase
MPSNVSRLHVSCTAYTDCPGAALARVPEIKPRDVEEVFFGNVLSAKYAYPFPQLYLSDAVAVLE